MTASLFVRRVVGEEEEFDVTATCGQFNSYFTPVTYGPRKISYMRGARNLTGDNLKLVRAEFSTIN